MFSTLITERALKHSCNSRVQQRSISHIFSTSPPSSGLGALFNYASSSCCNFIKLTAPNPSTNPPAPRQNPGSGLQPPITKTGTKPQEFRISYIGVKKDASQKMHDEVQLVSCLLNNIHHDINLSQRALYGLADLMYRVQEFCDKSIR
jgi:hypothetical protein